METLTKKPGRPSKTEVVLERGYVPQGEKVIRPAGDTIKVDKAELEWITSHKIGRPVNG
jgi:hypothetical protein